MVIRLAIGFLIILLIISGCAAESELEPTPEPLASFWARAEPAIADRRYGEAVEILEQAVVLYPEQTTLLLKIGQIYLIQHRWRLAEDAFNRAIAGGGASAAASAGLAEAWLNQGELIKARQMWQQAAALDPDLPGVFTGLGRTHLRLFEFEAAQAAFLEQQTHTPDFEADWYLATLTAPSDIKLGLSYLQSIPTPGDNGAPPIAESLLSRRDYLHQTLAPFSSSSAQADVAKAIGVALVQVEQWPLAIHALRLAVADNPIDQAQDAEAVAFLAHALGQAGKPALDLFEQARHLDPESALPLYFQGIYLRQQGAFKAAEEKLLRAIELDPDNAAIHAEMGRISEQAGNLTLAEAWYLAAIEVSDQEFAFQRLLLRFYANRSFQLTEAALPLAEQLIEQNPDRAELYDLLGWVEFLSGAAGGGEESLRKAIELEPDLVSAHYHLARLLESRGQVSLAEIEYQTVIDLETTQGFRQRALQDLARLQQGRQ